jgi:hypothetical protein
VSQVSLVHICVFDLFSVVLEGYVQHAGGLITTILYVGFSIQKAFRHKLN